MRRRDEHPPGRAGARSRGIGRVGAIRWILGLVVAATLLWLVFESAWERLLFAPVEGFTRHEPDARYEALFPYYVELCAATQFRSDTKGRGGTPGTP